MPMKTVLVIANDQEIIPAKVGKCVKIIAFWVTVPVSHSFGFKNPESGDIYFRCVTGAQDNAFIGGLNLGDKSDAYFPSGFAVNAHFAGTGTVYVTVTYSYI